MSFLSFDSVSLLPALDTFKVSDTELANKSGGASAVSIDDLMVKVADGGGQGTIVAGSDKTMSSGLNRMAAASAIPNFQGQGIKAPEGSSSLFVMADARPVEVYGCVAGTNWVKLDDLSAKGSKSYNMNTEFVHEQHGAITISELFVRDPAATADSRGIFRIIPQGGAVIGGGSSGFKNSFSKGVEMSNTLTVAGKTTLSSLWVGEDVPIKRIAADGAGTLSSLWVGDTWTVNDNILKPTPSVVGATPSFFLHKDKGVAMPADDGKLYAIRMGAGGVMTSVEVGTYVGNVATFDS